MGDTEMTLRWKEILSTAGGTGSVVFTGVIIAQGSIRMHFEHV